MDTMETLTNLANTTDNEIGIRLEAILLLSDLDGPEVIQCLQRVAEADADAAWMVAEAVARREDGGGLLRQLALHDHFYVRLVVADALALRHDCIDLLERLACDDEDDRVKQAGARSMDRRFGLFGDL